MIAAFRYGRCCSTSHWNGPAGAAVGVIGASRPRNIGDEGWVIMTAAMTETTTPDRHNTEGSLPQADRIVVNAGSKIRNGKTTNEPNIKNRKKSD